MATTTGAAVASQRSRRFTFSLRTLLLSTAVVSLVFAYVGNLLIRIRQQRTVLEVLCRDQGSFTIKTGNSSNGARSLPIPWLSSSLDRITRASLGRLNPTNDEELEKLNQLPNLRSVDIYGGAAGDNAVRRVASLQGLESLGLHEVAISAAATPSIRSNLKLRYLKLRGAFATDEILNGLRGCQVGHLTLEEAAVTSKGLAALGHFPQLHTLEIHNCPGVDSIEHLPSLDHLTTVSLQYSPIIDDGVRNLSRFPRLSILDLSFTKVTDAVVPQLSELQRPMNVQLIGTGLSDAGLSRLGALDDHGTVVVSPPVSEEAVMEFTSNHLNWHITLRDAGAGRSIRLEFRP